MLVAIAALLAGVLVDGLLHGVVESGLALFQLCQLVLADDFPGLLVEVCLLVVLGQLERGDIARQHFCLCFCCAGSRESVADGVDALVVGLFGLFLEHVLQLLQHILQKKDCLVRLGALLKATHEVTVQRFKNLLVLLAAAVTESSRIFDDSGSFPLFFGLPGLFALRFLHLLQFFLERDDEFEPSRIDFILLGLADVLVKIGKMGGNGLQLVLGRSFQ